MDGEPRVVDSAWQILRSRASSRRLTKTERLALHRLEVALHDVAVVVVAHRRDLDEHGQRLTALEAGEP